MSYKKDAPPPFAPKAIPAPNGWEKEDTGELLICQNGGLSKPDVAGEIGRASFVGANWVRAGACSVKVRMNDYVDVTLGASIVISSTGSGNLTLYADAQTETLDVIFDRDSDNDPAVVPNEAAIYSLGAQTISGTIEDTDGDGAADLVLSAKQAKVAGHKTVA